MTIKALLLDFDGVLMDSEMIYHRIWNNVLQDFGHELSVKDYSLYYLGMPIQRQAAAATRQFSLLINPQILTSIYRYSLERYLQRYSLPLMDEILTILHFCKGHQIKLALVSSNEKNLVLACLQHYQLQNFFEVIVTGADTQQSKPAPEGYLLALSALGLNARHCLAVEDSANGIRAAKAAGLCCLGLTHSYTYPDELGQANWRANSHSDIMATLQQCIAA